MDYELDWPADLLARELRALFDHPYRGWTGGEVELLLREAFHTAVPAAEFVRLHSTAEWTDDLGPTRRWIADLFKHLPEMRRYAPPRPYWAARRAGAVEVPARDPADVMHRFADLVGLLHGHGYLARDFAEPCVDVDPDEHLGRDLNFELRTRLHDVGSHTLWPLQPEIWDTDIFYSLIEVFHDLVARPRRCWLHDHNHCGLHFEVFDTDAGRRVYRGLVNRLLAEHAVELRLAADGEDEGQLVHVVDEARADLVAQALQAPDTGVQERVRHAVAQFRGRTATVYDKRLAVLTLAGILEERRELIGTRIGSKDEGALFQIANQFAIRHQHRNQQGDYDPVFLDWIFWWYLGTVELTDRLLDRSRVTVQHANPLTEDEAS